MTFRLSGPHPLADLLLELAQHDDWVVRVAGHEHRPEVTVEAADSATAMWDVRATVGMFDDGSVELPGPVADRST